MGDGCDILTIRSAETETLLRALARLTDLEWTVTVVVDAEDEQTGFADRLRHAPALEPCLAAAGCYVHAAGEQEPQPPLLAALRHGLPVALITGPGAPLSLPADASVVVGRGAADDLSKALRRIVFDTALRARMAAAARAYGATLTGEA